MTYTASQLQRLASLCAEPESDASFDDALASITQGGVDIDHFCDYGEKLHELIRTFKNHRVLFDRDWDARDHQDGVSKDVSFLVLLANACGVAMAMYSKDWRENDLRIVNSVANAIGRSSAQSFQNLINQYLHRPFMKDITPHVPTSNTRN